MLVTQRAPNDGLYREILAMAHDDASRLPFSLARIGDVDAPAIVAAAVYAGHRYGAELEEVIDIDEPMKHDRPDIASEPADLCPPATVRRRKPRLPTTPAWKG